MTMATTKHQIGETFVAAYNFVAPRHGMEGIEV